MLSKDKGHATVASRDDVAHARRTRKTTLAQQRNAARAHKNGAFRSSGKGLRADGDATAEGAKRERVRAARAAAKARKRAARREDRKVMHRVARREDARRGDRGTQREEALRARAAGEAKRAAKRAVQRNKWRRGGRVRS